MKISVIIPACNEAAVIGDCLRALRREDPEGCVEVIAVCNGCVDKTADVARAVPGVRVLTSEVPSKVKAINLGVLSASGDVIVVMDADIRLTGTGVRGLAEALAKPGVFAAAPRASMFYAPDTSWLVRCYYRVWFSLGYVNEGMMGCGVYALNSAGRARVFPLPDVIADDGYVRASFAADERVRVDDAVSVVRAPRTFANLLKIKTRSRLGGYQLLARYRGSLPGDREDKRRVKSWLCLLVNPLVWPAVLVYLYLNATCRDRAKAQLARLDSYVWERDDSARSIAEQSCEQELP